MSDSVVPFEHFVEQEQLLWGLAIAFYLVGDTVTTFWGLSTDGVVEAGPIAGPLIEAYGRFGLLAIKAVTFGFFVGVWSLFEPPTRVAVPLAVLVVGAAVTIWNLAVILNAMLF